MRWGQKAKRKFGEKAELFFYNDISEKFGGTIEQVNNSWDFEIGGIPVEVKSAQLCINRGRKKPTEEDKRVRYNYSGFTLDETNHDELIKRNGWYCFVLMVKEECLKITMMPANKIYNHFMYKLKPMIKTRIAFSVFYSKNSISISDFVENLDYESEKEDVLREEAERNDLSRIPEEERRAMQGA